MHLAFLLYRYFPYGGMQRDFLRFAQAIVARGHQVRVYTLSWEGDIPDYLDVCLVPVSGFSNHRRNERYISWVLDELEQNPVDGVIGFNKMPGLDVYYAADSCFRYKAEHERRWWYRLTPRYRFFSVAEQAVFGTDSMTEILLISRTEEAKFSAFYHTQHARLHMLPPGIDPERRATGEREAHRCAVRAELSLDTRAELLLFVGSGFIKKGLDRAIHTLAALAQTGRDVHLLVAGQDRDARFRRQARRLGVADRCHFLGGRDDVPVLLAGADLLIHPALDEAAGIALLEAVVAGLPVVVTEVCGYAHHIAAADCGRVLSAPFLQAALDRAVTEVLAAGENERCRSAALAYAASEDLYSMHETGARLIEELVTAHRAKVEAGYR